MHKFNGPRGISVAMATYNGEPFIIEQLKSISDQVLQPQEIVIVDDASTDATVSIIEDFQRSTSIPIKLIRSEINRGSTLSFSRAIAECSYEWIALADQDDFWIPEKLSLLSEMAETNRLDMVFSDADFVDSKLMPLNKRLLVNSRLSLAMRRQFANGDGLTTLLKYNVVTGATMMFHAKWRDLVLPVSKNWIHDYWIAILISAVGRVGLCERSLILYRQHGQNQIGAKVDVHSEMKIARNKSREKYLGEAAAIREIKERLRGAINSYSSALDALDQKESFLMRRYFIRGTIVNRVKYVFMNIAQHWYFRYGQGLRTLMKDLMLP